MKKTLAIGLIGLAGLSAGVAAFGGHMSPVLHEAVQAGDDNTFVDTLSAIDPVAAEHMNQGLFDRMQTRFQEQEQVQAAVEAGDYQAFLDAEEH